MLYKNAVEPTTLELLIHLCSQPSLNSFALGGGTSIALRKGHRLSAVLNFFTSTSFNNLVIYQTLTGQFPNAELLFEQNQTMMFMINGIKVDFILYPFEWLQPFDFIEGIRLISIPDIIPMKLQAIGNRFSKKDYWDVDRLLHEYPLEEMVKIFKAKFPPIDTGYIIHSLTAFESAETEEDPVCLVPKTWKEVKANLEQAVRDYTKKFL
jgi:hypothetical protein